MDWIQKIGGRKFWMALLTVGVATFIELRNPQGLSATMAAFLGSIVAAFSASNYLATAKHMDSRGGGRQDVSAQLETLSNQIQQATDPQQVQQVVELLSQTLSKVNEVEIVSRQMGNGVVNLGNQVQLLSKKLS